jgi:invasion protein IalB
MLLAALLLPPLSAAARAQPAPRGAPADGSAPIQAQPERTSAQFGDWTVQCAIVNPGSRRVCEMAQTVQDQQRQQAVAVIAVGRAAKDQPVKLAARVPVNVQVTHPVRLQLEGNAGADTLTLGFERCTISPLGCFAETQLREEVLRRLRARAADQGGRLVWRDAAGGEAAVPISFRGFAAAYEALLRESA